jgi:hypothetical protein
MSLAIPRTYLLDISLMEDDLSPSRPRLSKYSYAFYPDITIFSYLSGGGMRHNRYILLQAPAFPVDTMEK